MVYFLFCKMLSLLWQMCDIIGLIFTFVNAQLLKNNLTIWSHWRLLSCSFATSDILPFSLSTKWRTQISCNLTPDKRFGTNITKQMAEKTPLLCKFHCTTDLFYFCFAYVEWTTANLLLCSIQTSQTGCHLYSDTSPCRVSEYTLDIVFTIHVHSTRGLTNALPWHQCDQIGRFIGLRNLFKAFGNN